MYKKVEKDAPLSGSYFSTASNHEKHVHILPPAVTITTSAKTNKIGLITEAAAFIDVIQLDNYLPKRGSVN